MACDVSPVAMFKNGIVSEERITHWRAQNKRSNHSKNIYIDGQKSPERGNLIQGEGPNLHPQPIWWADQSTAAGILKIILIWKTTNPDENFDIILALLGALSRRSNCDNRLPIPSIRTLIALTVLNHSIVIWNRQWLTVTVCDWPQLTSADLDW